MQTVKCTYPFSLILLFTAALTSCTVSYKSGYNANKNKIAINLKEHNLGYMFPPDTLASLFKPENLDKFDYSFLTNTYRGLNDAGFSDQDSAELGNIALKNCVIDFKFIPAFPTSWHNDTLWLNYLQANLICQNSNTKNGLFYASAQIPENFQTIRHTKTGDYSPNWLPANVQRVDTARFNIYTHQGFNQDLLLKLSNELASNAVSKIDTLARYDFTTRHPDLAAETETIKHLHPGVNVLLLVVIVIGAILLN